MINLLAVTPFGFVLERRSTQCYSEKTPYQIFLNGAFFAEGDKTIFSLFGLAPDCEYQVELRGVTGTQQLMLRTQKAGFVINVRDYNARGDGAANDTSAVNAAIYTAPGGSTVVLPKGVYLVDQVFLKDNVDLYLEEGAVLLHNADRDSLAILKGYQKDYDHADVTVNASWEGHPLDCFCSLVYGRNVKNARVYGPGVLDGNGWQGGWWEEPKAKNRAFRPRNVFLNNCENIAVLGLTSRNSAAWNIHPFYSTGLSFYDLTIQSAPDSPNTDGLNPESCENVVIAGCHFQVGDDCIALKSGKYYMSRRHFRPCRNITIRGCRMEEGHGGVVIGSEIACGVSNVRVERCLFRNTDRGLRVKTRRGRGDTSVVDGIHFSDVEMEGVRHCFVVNMFYNCDPDGHSDYVRGKEALPVDSETPAVRNIHLCGVKAKGIGGSGVFVYGLPESPVAGVRIENCSFAYLPDRPGECPAMMDDAVEIPDLGIFVQNGEVGISHTVCTGPYTNRINGEETNG